MASTVPATRGSSRGRKPTRGIRSRLASSSVRAVELGEGVAFGVEAVRQTSAWIVSRSARQRSTGPCRPVRSTRLDHPVAADPRHHLGVDEVPAGAAHLPEAVVGLVPVALEEVQQCDLQVPGVVGGADAASRVRCRPSRTSPHTSSWNWSAAALPTRTGRGALVAGQPGQSVSGSRRVPSRPYMICRSAGSPATARSSQSRQAVASST